MRKTVLPLLLACTLLLTSCTTYHLSTQSLLQQLVNSGIQKRGVVTGNDLTTITCLDKKGMEHTLTVVPRTQIRITKQNNSRTTIYFYTLTIKDSALSGSKSNIVNLPIKPIPLSDIMLLEVQ